MTEKLQVVHDGKSDADRATEIKQRVLALLEPVCRELESATKGGFGVVFNIGPGPLGNQTVTQLKVIKEF